MRGGFETLSLYPRVRLECERQFWLSLYPKGRLECEGVLIDCPFIPRVGLECEREL